MGDTKEGRDEQARDAEDRQRDQGTSPARDRADEAEPPDGQQGDAEEIHRAEDEYPDSSRECHRRGCDEAATFLALERYQEETGHGAVEAEALLCREHTAEESPTNLDGAYADYVFRVAPLPGTGNTGSP